VEVKKPNDTFDQLCRADEISVKPCEDLKAAGKTCLAAK
jgi:hypothetical protein